MNLNLGLIPSADNFRKSDCYMADRNCLQSALNQQAFLGFPGISGWIFVVFSLH